MPGWSDHVANAILGRPWRLARKAFVMPAEAPAARQRVSSHDSSSIPAPKSDIGGAPKSAASSKLLLATTLAIASVLLLLLEFRWPYYFLQDDGLEYFLPAYFHNWKSLLAGHLPLYDFHIFAGVPHAAVGQPAVFYVPQYFATFLSESIWGHPFATIDLMAFMHGLIAVAGGYVLLRYLGASEAAASFGGLAAFSGFFVWAGRLWPGALILCAWFPWMVWASLRYLGKPGAGRAGWLMFFRLGLLYGGQPQFFVLAMIFEHLFGLSYTLAKRREGWGLRYLGYIALDLPTALLGLPLLLPMWSEVGRSLDRARPLSYTEFSSLHISPIFWLMGQLFVFIRLNLPRDYVTQSIPYLSYIGYIASILPLGAVVLWKKQPKSRPWLMACCACFVIALLWCWNVLGPVIYHLPVLNRFRWPFKLIYFAGFFQCLVAALVLTVFSRRWQRVAIALFLVNWVVVFCILPNHAWRVREYHPPLKSHWVNTLKNGRYLVVSEGPVFSGSDQLVELDYSELWGLDNLLGYEPLLPQRNAQVVFGKIDLESDLHSGSYDGSLKKPFLAHLKEWSVKYVLVGPARAYVSSKLAAAGYRRQEEKQGWTLWKDPAALPRVRWADAGEGSGAGAGIRWTEHVNSIDVDLSEWPGRQLVFAFAANHGLETCFAGHCRPVAHSPDGLIRVEIPVGTRHVRLVYHNALFLPAILIAVATLAVYLLLVFRSIRLRNTYEGLDYEPGSSDGSRLHATQP